MAEIGNRMRYRIEETRKYGERPRTVARFAEQAVAEVCITRMAEAFSDSTFVLYGAANDQRELMRYNRTTFANGL